MLRRTTRRLLAGPLLLLLTGTLAAQRAEAQRVVVNADEWTWGDCCITAGGRDGDDFAVNTRNWLTGGTPGNILVYSSNFGLAEGQLAGVMNTGGYTWNVVTPGSAAATTAWANRASYEAIFVGGNAVPSIAELVAYVEGGGSVYLMGGTGTTGLIGGSEGAYWNPFLSRFGLAFGTAYNNIGGNINTSGYAAQGPFGAALFSNVNVLFQDNGNTISASALPADVTRQIFVANQAGLFAAASIGAQSTVPEPATVALLAGGLVAIGLGARARRRPA